MRISRIFHSVLTLSIGFCVLATALPAHAQAKKYTSIGDSLTVGLYADAQPGQDGAYPHGFAAQVRDFVVAGRGFSSANYRNRAISGATVDTVIANELSAAVADAPDLVTMTIGGNDAKNYYLANGAADDTKAAAFKAGFQGQLRQVLSQLRQSAGNPVIILSNVPKLWELPAIYSQVPFGTTDQKKAAAQQMLGAYVTAANEAIAAVAAGKTLDNAIDIQGRAVDLYNNPQATDPTNISTIDYFHPNRAGHDILAQAFIANVPANPSAPWRATDLALGSDNLARLLWSRPDKAFAFWTLSASNAITSTPLYGPIIGWNASAIGVAGDSKIRALISNADGRAAAWRVQNGASGSITSTPAYGPYGGFTCREIAAAPDNTTRLLWIRSDGAFAVWAVDGSGGFTSTPLFGPIAGWSANAISVGGDNKTTILLNNTDGRAAVWTVQNAQSGTITSTPAYGPISGFSCRDLATGADNKTRLLWVRADSAFAIWTAEATNTPNNFTSTPLYGPISGWSGIKIGVGGDSKTRVLLTNTDGRAAVWTIQDAAGNITSTPAYGPIAFSSASPVQSAAPTSSR